MLTTRFSENYFRSIMLTTGFSEKSPETFFYNIYFWTFLKCPISEKNFLSFKIVFSYILFIQ